MVSTLKMKFCRKGCTHTAPMERFSIQGPRRAIGGMALGACLLLSACTAPETAEAPAHGDPQASASPAASDLAGHAPTEPSARAEPAPPSPAAAPAGPPQLQLEPFTQEIEDTALSFTMLPVPGGRVRLDTPQGVQTVRVDPFWIAPVETTWDLYDAFHLRLDRRRSLEGTAADAVTRPSNPYLPPDRGYGHGRYAAISISHFGAETFCEWLTLKTGRTYRLPTEAEWRLACERGEVAGASPDEVAWHAGNADFSTHPVGSKRPNALGLFDMKGNAAEWCTTLDGGYVVMGGSFHDAPEALGCASRVAASPRWNESDPQLPKGKWWLADADFVGFRLVCEPGSGEVKENQQ